jgi:hypothetical protein
MVSSEQNILRVRVNGIKKDIQYCKKNGKRSFQWICIGRVKGSGFNIEFSLLKAAKWFNPAVIDCLIFTQDPGFVPDGLKNIGALKDLKKIRGIVEYPDSIKDLAPVTPGKIKIKSFSKQVTAGGNLSVELTHKTFLDLQEQRRDLLIRLYITGRGAIFEKIISPQNETINCKLPEFLPDTKLLGRPYALSVTSIPRDSDSDLISCADTSKIICGKVNVLPSEKSVKAKFPVCKIKNINGVLCMTADDKPFGRFIYRDANSCHEDIYRRISKAGIETLNLWLGGDSYYRDKNGKLDFRKIDAFIQSKLAYSPNCRIILGVGMGAGVKGLPESELNLFDDGTCSFKNYAGLKNFKLPSMASKVWTENLYRDAMEIVEHMEKQAYASNITAVLTGDGGSGEWRPFWEHGRGGKFGDFSPAAKNRFKEWMKARWQGEKLASVRYEIPELKDYSKISGMEILEPKKYGRFIDYSLFWNSIIPDAIERFCAGVKKGSSGALLAGAFGGYSFEASMHYKYIGSLCESPYLNFLVNCTSYSDRAPGGVCSPAAPLGSMRLHDKVNIDEVDNRTYRTPLKYYPIGRTPTKRETIENLKRQFAHSLITGSSFWLFSMTDPPGWFDEPDIMKTMRLNVLLEEYSMKEYNSFPAEIAVVLSEKSRAYYKDSKNSLIHGSNILYNSLVKIQREILGRIGAPYHIYLLEDILSSKTPDYKFYIFMDIASCKPELVGMLQDKFKRNNAMVLWKYSSGLIAENRIAEENMERLTGFKIKMKEKSKLQLLKKKIQHPFLNGLPDYPVAGLYAYPVNPYFYVDSKDRSVAIAEYEDGKTGIAFKDFKGFRSIYCAVPYVGPSLLRNIAKEAGVHIWSDSNCYFNANNLFLSIHTGGSGTYAINLPQALQVYDVYMQKAVSKGKIQNLNLELPAHKTKLFYLGDWKKLDKYLKIKLQANDIERIRTLESF